MKEKTERNLQIKEEYRKGVKQTVIADLHNISKQAVGVIVHRKPRQTAQNQRGAGFWGRVIGFLKRLLHSSLLLKD